MQNNEKNTVKKMSFTAVQGTRQKITVNNKKSRIIKSYKRACSPWKFENRSAVQIDNISTC